METLNETGEMVLISGRSKENRKGASGQDVLGQTHCVMLVPVYTQQGYLSCKSVTFLVNQIPMLSHPGNFCGLSPPQLKIGFKQFLEIREKSTSWPATVFIHS